MSSSRKQAVTHPVTNHDIHCLTAWKTQPLHPFHHRNWMLYKSVKVVYILIHVIFLSLFFWLRPEATHCSLADPRAELCNETRDKFSCKLGSWDDDGVASYPTAGNQIERLPGTCRSRSQAVTHSTTIHDVCCLNSWKSQLISAVTINAWLLQHGL